MRETGRFIESQNGQPDFVTGLTLDITQRKQAEESLRHSERDLNDFFDTAAIGLHWVGPEGTILRVNQAELDMLGYTREEFLGGHIAEFHADQPVIEDMLARLTQGETLREHPARLRCKDGSIRHVLINSSGLFENGRFVLTRCFTTDVTERRRAEQALAIRSNQQRAVAALGQFALSEPELGNVFDEAVRTVAHTLGNEYCKVLELLPGGDEVCLVSGVGWKQGLVGTATVPTNLESQAGYTLVAEGPVISRDLRTETRFRGPQLLIDHGVISGMSCIIAGAADKPWGVLGTHTTTEREFSEDDVHFLLAVANVISNAIRRSQQEGEVRRSAETFAALVEQSPLGIYTVDADFRIANISVGSAPAFRNVQPVVGRDFAEVTHAIWPEPFASEAIAIFRRVLETGEPYISPGLTEQRKDIAEIESYEWQVNRVILADGRPGVVCYYYDATRIQRANAALRESEERLRSIFTQTLAGIAETDLTGRFVHVNDRYCEIVGRTAKELYGLHMQDITHPDDLTRNLPLFKRAVTEGVPFNIEKRYVRPDGSLVWVHNSVSLIRDENGAPRHIAAVSLDISDRKQGEEQLREQEAQYRSIFESTSDAFLVFDYDGRLIEANPAGCDMHGYSHDEFIGMHGRQFIHPDDHHKFADFVRKVSAREPFHVEVTHLRKDGQPIAIQVHGTSFVFGGRPALLAVGRDVTDEKRALEALRDSEERFRAMADNIPQLAWMADGEGWTFWYNQQWYDYTGTNLEQMQGWGWKAVHHPEHVDRVVEKVARHFREGLVWEDTFPLRGSDGQYRWFLSRMTPIRDESGRVVRFFGTNTDVTEQLAAEEGLREADRRKNEFLAMLAHELRNPLAPIRNAVQALRLTRGNGESIGPASEMMERQVGQLVRLVDDLLDVSRISRGKIELRMERVELQSIVHHAVEAARPLVQRMNHDLTVTMSSQPIYLNSDPTRLTQVVGNLLNNACKFTDKGGRIWLTVDLAGAAASAPRDEAVIRVRDNGIGLASDQLPRIFEMFTQVDTSLERTQTGLGIGLTLVKNLVEMHGGTVEVDSRGIGKGSEFVVRLPILVESVAAPLKPTASEPASRTARRILVVDDNRDSATSLAMLLRMIGHQTHTAYDGPAVEAAAAFQPDVVPLDIGLPKLNGYEACRRIREQPWGKKMTLVALTGWGQEEDRQKSKEAGFDNHLVKPVDLDILTKLLAEGDG